MTDDELRDTLAGLGVTTATARALTLLPLVQVAWTDGEIQAGERAMVLGLAEQAGLDAACVALVESWMAKRPSGASFVRARSALVELARRGDLEHQEVTGIVDGCAAVAAAAGGIFGVVLTVSGAEQAVIADIARALSIGPSVALDDALGE